MAILYVVSANAYGSKIKLYFLSPGDVIAPQPDEIWRGDIHSEAVKKRKEAVAKIRKEEIIKKQIERMSLLLARPWEPKIR